MSTVTTVRRAAQNLRLVGPGYVVRVAQPASIVRAYRRPPLTQEESEIYSFYGGESAYGDFLNRLATFANDDLGNAPGP